jgi:hypothetical protein
MQHVHGAASHHLSTPELDLFVTARGGHMAPVVFHLDGRDVSPYSVSPWQPHEFPDQPHLLSVLRGDFFCLPFGGQLHGPPHGDPANAEWLLASIDGRCITLRQKATDTDAVVEKILSTRPEHHAVYIEHRISELDGDYNYGTHPILDLSAMPEGAARISVSPFKWASVFPGKFSDPANGEQQTLKPAAEFTDLHAVPMMDGGSADLTRYPARAGNDDLVMMVNEVPHAGQPFAWSAAVMDGWMWFSLKNPDDFPATLFWMSNGGRSGPPWNGRHLGRIGIEEVCSYFSNGVDESRKASPGFPTTRRFTAGETVSLKVVQGVAAVPDDFGMTISIRPVGENSVAITGEPGKEIIIPIEWEFVL